MPDLDARATLSRDHTGRLRVTIECDGPEAYELAGQKSREDDCLEVLLRLRPLAAVQRADRSSRAELIEDDAPRCAGCGRVFRLGKYCFTCAATGRAERVEAELPAFFYTTDSPTAHKSLADYAAQLKAKRKRR